MQLQDKMSGICFDMLAGVAGNPQQTAQTATGRQIVTRSMLSAVNL